MLFNITNITKTNFIFFFQHPTISFEKREKEKIKKKKKERMQCSKKPT